MPLSNERKEYLYQYQKEKLKRVPLDLQKPFYEEVQAAAADLGESVNGYIKRAIREQLTRDAAELERIRRQRAEDERQTGAPVNVDDFI